jgi:hypothetical protein
VANLAAILDAFRWAAPAFAVLIVAAAASVVILDRK